MINKIIFENFRNIDGEYNFVNDFNVIIGKNNSGKSNFLEGIRLAFSAIDGTYFKIKKSDFVGSDDNKTIKIKVKMDKDDIPTLNDSNKNGEIECGFIVKIYKIKNGKYKKEITSYNDNYVDREILEQDEKIPEICEIPYIRAGEININGLMTGIKAFLEDDDEYIKIKEKSKEAFKGEIKEKEQIFKNFCKKFNQKFEVSLTDAKIENEKVYIIKEGQEEHKYNIGAGYKSIANIILNVMMKKNVIILIDEIENSLHPALIRMLIRELKILENVFVVTTTHSPIVINEMNIENVIDISGVSFNKLDNIILKKLNMFMHPGRGELLLADNVVLVEGYTEELLLLIIFAKIKKILQS